MFEFLDSTEKKMGHVLDLSWEVLFRRILSGRIQINKESSMQLHYSSIIHELGELLCLSPSEAFAIELEHSIND